MFEYYFVCAVAINIHYSKRADQLGVVELDKGPIAEFEQAARWYEQQQCYEYKRDVGNIRFKFLQ